jgi:hypothetical protein
MYHNIKYHKDWFNNSEVHGAGIHRQRGDGINLLLLFTKQGK